MAERQAGSVLETRPRPEETAGLMRISDIRDIKIKNPEGEELGDLTDLAIDRESGRIAYAVLSYGGILGFGEKHFAIPWEAVRTHPGERAFVVDADKRTLDGTPGFARDAMPREGDWSLIRTLPPPSGAAGPSPPGAERGPLPSREERPAETKSPGAESVLPPQPAVQTVAGGWGGQPTRQQTEERPVEAEARPRETVVEEVREEPARARTVPPSAHLSAADLQVYLKGIDYPAGKQDLIDHARERNASGDVIAALELFGERTYQSAADVSVEFGKETRREHPTKTRETAVEEIREERHETRRTPSLKHLSAADLQVYLKGMNYPAGKQDLIDHARGRNASEDVIAALELFGERTYRSAADVSEEFGRVK